MDQFIGQVCVEESALKDPSNPAFRSVELFKGDRESFSFCRILPQLQRVRSLVAVP